MTYRTYICKFNLLLLFRTSNYDNKIIIYITFAFKFFIWYLKRECYFYPDWFYSFDSKNYFILLTPLPVGGAICVFAES